MTAQQLKNSILQMAVQGKLVPQDPNDEPASVLLERIRAEKEQLIKEKKIKKEKTPSIIFRGADNLPYEKVGKNEPVCIVDQIPFEIPESWEWVRLTTLGEIVGGGTPKTNIPEYWDKGNIPWLTPADMKFVTGKYVDKGERCITEEGLKGSSAHMMPAGTIVYSSRAPIGYIAIASTELCTNQGFKSLVPVLTCIDDYVYYCLIAFTPEIQSRASGTTFKEISGTEFGKTLIPLPPLAEQQRIVKRIEDVLPALKMYDTKETALHKMNGDFPDQLRKSILQWAVQGKLVHQDPTDEPASILLERIRAEKQQLVKEGKIKKDKHESVIFRRDNSYYEKCDSEEVCIDDQLPFEIPENWRWVKLSDLVQFIGGYAYKSGSFIEKSEYQVLRLGNIKNDEIRYSTKPVFISKELAEKTADFQCKKYDILLTMTGTRLKRDYFYTVLVREKDTNCFINQRVGCLRCYFTGLCRWLIWTLKSEGILSQVFQYETGTANQGNLGAENIMKTFIPLPPLEEQERICNLIDRILMQINTL